MRTRTLLLICALTFSMQANAADKLRIVADDWPPYSNAYLYRNGFAVVIVTEAMRRAGYESTVSIAPWTEIVAAAPEDAYDVVVAAWQTDARNRVALFSEPYLRNEFILVKRTDNEVRVSSREDLSGLRIGVVQDYAYSEEPVSAAGLDLKESGSVKENIELLRDDELDVVLADSRVARYVIDSMLLGKELELIYLPVATRELRMAVLKSRDDAATIVTAFNTALADMRADGSYNAILNTFRVSE